ncbi:MAG TPA: FHA domain-containing protein [Oceanobacillus sp.]|nr:FHA domain-containing protein [Oceanobacillus sp.]
MAETLAIPWVIELHNQQMPETLKVQVESQVIIGRYDKASQVQPDIDLGVYGAEEKGVSRRHLAIRADEDQLVVVDLNSGNGTLLNGNRLEPNVPHPVKNDDKLQLGLMQLDLRVIISPKGSGFQMQGKKGITPRPPSEVSQPILIVEDDPEVAKVLALVLERNGYSTVTCREVVSAIRLFNQKHPSAVILDLMLPDMPGMEFCRYVRRDVQRNTTPVIVISAAKTPANVTQALDAGADIFLGKPVSAQELNHVVDSLIGQNESGERALLTKQLVGTAPLKSVPPESRRDSLVIFVAGHEQPLTLTVQQPISFGRSTPQPPKTHIDLSRFNAVEHGVSRVHMTLHNKEGKFFVEDMDSVNGTYINGDPLKPRELVPLKNADEVRLGRLRLYVYFLEDEKG